MSRSIRLHAVLTIGLIVSAVPASAAPPLFERYSEYRILDASGRISPRAATDASGRVALRPAYSPPLLMRGRPLYLSGYAGATYGRDRYAPPVPTGYHTHGGLGLFGHGH
jgi:hypothetical protein